MWFKQSSRYRATLIAAARTASAAAELDARPASVTDRDDELGVRRRVIRALEREVPIPRGGTGPDQPVNLRAA